MVAAGAVKNPKTKNWVVSDIVRSRLVEFRIQQHFGGFIKKHCPQLRLAKRPRLIFKKEAAEAESPDDDEPNVSQSC